MTTLALQKDLVCDLKKELCSNIGLLIKLKPMATELSNNILKNNGLEKPSRYVFNHLSYYFMSIIDSEALACMPWPLYDSKIEKLYREELCKFINNSNTDMLSPVTSAYLVNLGSFKVIKLLYQMSTLSVQKLLLKNLSKDRQKTVYEKVTEKYTSNISNDDFMEEVNEETDQILRKFSKYISKHKALVHIVKIMHNKIVKMDETLSTCNAQMYIDGIINEFIKKQSLDEAMKIEVQKIKDISKPSTVLDMWLADVDTQLDEMEHKWHDKMEPFQNLCQKTQQCTQDLIARHVGEMDRSMYMIEYNPRIDQICTKDLESHVNMEQKYVLKNIVRDGSLNFPYLIRGFLVAICYILKNAGVEEEIHRFNEYLDNGKSNYVELVSSLRILIDRIVNNELRLQQSIPAVSESYKPKQILSIPPIPDLTDLRSNRNNRNQVLFDTFTPLNISKHQFNLCKRKNISFIRRQSMLTTPCHQFLREETFKSLVTCRTNSDNRQNISQNFHNISIVPQLNRINETISECGTGFTKEQIQRLLSTVKKKSTTKKSKLNFKRPNKHIVQGGLFNESSKHNENVGMVRSHSSPNLFENRLKRSFPKLEGRSLSIMQEQEHLEVSGIVALENENEYGAPQSLANFANLNATSLPIIIVTPEPEKELCDNFKDTENSVNEDIAISEINLIKDENDKTETPKNNAQLIRKTTSLEKIINRFKRIKANTLNTDNTRVNTHDIGECSKTFKTIAEEKEDLKTREENVDMFTVNRNLLPDLLSPSFSRLSQDSTDFLDQICYKLDEKVNKKPRESLGTALGVDDTFLDQFDLID